MARALITLDQAPIAAPRRLTAEDIRLLLWHFTGDRQLAAQLVERTPKAALAIGRGSTSFCGRSTRSSFRREAARSGRPRGKRRHTPW